MAFERALRGLAQLQERVSELTSDRSAGFVGYTDRVMVGPCHNGIAVEYYGECFGEAWGAFLATVCEQPVADSLASITIGGPDQGANGIRPWEFDTLINSDVRFPALRQFCVEPTEPNHHNATVMTRSRAGLAESGVIANVVSRMPLLIELTVPTYPSADFFELTNLDNLACLTIGGDYDPGNFIRQLGEARNLPNLRLLEFTDSEQPFLEHANSDKRRHSVKFEDYAALFTSELFDHLKVFRLRNAVLSEAEFLELQAKRPNVQFLVILSGRGTYVSHWPGQHFPHKHIILDKARWFRSAPND